MLTNRAQSNKYTIGEGFDAAFFGFALMFVFIVLVAAPFVLTPL